MDRVSADVGARIHQLREQRGLSLRSLARTSGLSINAISLIERGISSPTVSSLHRLSTALGMPIVDLFGQPDELPAVFVPCGHGRSTRAGDLVLENLAWGLAGQRLEPFLVTLDPGAGSGREAITHAGQELVYGLAGAVNYEVGTATFVLGPGATLLFDASAPHRWTNASAQPARFLLVMEASPHGLVSADQHLR